jgi:surface protein
LDLSTWDVSKVTSFAEMFDFCYSMTELNVSNWDVSNALTMADMFNYCSALSVLDVSSFVPSSCTSFEETFANLYNVEEIRFGDNFDTSSATTMAGMFSFLYLSSKGEGYEKKLKSLDVSFLNTSNVTTMYQMFTNFDSLEELTLNGWDTSNVRNMGSMFANCSNLIMLDLTSFNTRQVSASEYIFSGCDNLTTILKSSDFTLATPV